MTDTSPPRPHRNTYWVIPGRLLAGEYPGAPTEQQAKDRLKQFLDCGIDSFLDLTGQDELAPYAQLVAELAGERGMIVRHRRLTIRDMDIPERPEHMHTILTQIDKWLASGRNVYVHCWGGVGRTGMVIGCHLVHRGLEGQQALERMAELWQEVSEDKRRRFPGSPHTWQQLDYVRNWSTRT